MKAINLIKIVFPPLILLFGHLLKAQSFTQTVRGIVSDKQSQSTIPGVTVTIPGTTFGTSTDADGKFALTNIPIGRISIQFTYLGYKSIVLNNLILNAGKELILNISMEEQVNTIQEVVITSGTDKKNPLNEMATVSARSFSVDETNRYAGSLGDPSRMATNFAGVAVAGDSRNDIIIRGNSPMGLLWRLDGINIPNPNHFGSLGTTGGPVSILNNNLLENSDFMTGAFPAGYGNALSGAFDLKMRSGNNQQSEFLGQIGFNGFELGAEGPFSKNSNASYLANYRYSTLGLLNAAGIKFGYSSVPQYQDLSFKIDVPTGTKAGRFTVFGIGGKSYIELLDKNKKEGDFTVSGIAEDTYFGSNMGVIGASHKLFYNEKTLQTISAAVSGTQNIVKVDSLYNNKLDKKLRYGNNSKEIKYSLYYNLNIKLNAHHTLNFGVMEDISDADYSDSILQATSYIKLKDFTGTAALTQAYAKWQYKITDNLTLNTGLHSQMFSLNNTYSIEPRLGVKWAFTPKQSLSAGVGMHSQLQPMYVYFLQTQLTDGSYIKTNTNLKFTKSNHYILAYDNAFAPNWRIKVETYYQQLTQVPVETKPSAFSLLNIGADYVIPNTDSLVNNGSGNNYGAEFTLEKFFSKNYYLLATASLYDSKYKGSNGVEHNTAFNGNYTVNLLGGAEFNLDKDKKKVLTLNVKWNYAGGKRYTNIDLAASNIAHQAVYDNDHAYEQKYSDYSRLDFRAGFKLNGKRITQEWAFDIQNILNRKNVFQQVYNPLKNNLQTEYQLGLFPMMLYRINF